MTKNWIVVANRTGARIFENIGPGSGLAKLMELSHPEGRMKDQDFISDDKGRTHDRAGQGSHKMEPAESPSDHEDRHFAHDLAQALKKGLEEQHFTRLFVVAEAGFQGDIKAALDKKTASLLQGSLNKDLVHVEDKDIAGHLGDIIQL